MSREKALAFLKHAADDADLQAKIVAFAAQEGYQFTVDELTDAELDTTVGGLLISTSFPKVESTATLFPKVESPILNITPNR